MMKRFTLTLMGLLLMVGGVFSQDVTTLYLEGGGNWKGSNAESGYFTSGYTYGNVQFDSNDLGGKWKGIGGSGWATTFGTNKTHRFTLTLNNYAPQAGFYFYILSKEDWNSENKYIIKTLEIPTDKKVISIDVNEEEKAPDGNIYAAVFIINLGSAKGNATSTLDIASITRAEISASSVAAPTISPASGTYDEDENLTVTITKGEGNAKVIYSVSGATTGNVTDAVFTETSKTLTLTGTGTITVTAIGYDAEDNPSSEVRNTYTTDVPSGKTSIASNNQTLPHTFNNTGDNIEFNQNKFNNENIVIGNYVVLDINNVANDNTWFCFKKGWGDKYFNQCTSIYSGNSANDCWVNKNDKYWWMKISDQNACSAFLGNNNVQIVGSKIKDTSTYSEMTVNSFSIYESKAISELVDNTIASKINNVVVELTRSLVAENWNTICLPFALTSAQATQLFGEGYQLAEFTGVSGTTLQFTKTDTFAAGVPYLVWPTASLSNGSPVVLIDVNITAKTPQPVPIDGYSFVGNFTQKSFNSGERSTTRFVGANNTLLTPNDESAMKSLRCYFTVPAGAQARSFTIDEEEGGTTNINAINGEGFMVNGYYNLNGQRVAQPTKGLFIVNGKKVVIK